MLREDRDWHAAHTSKRRTRRLCTRSNGQQTALSGRKAQFCIALGSSARHDREGGRRVDNFEPNNRNFQPEKCGL